MRAVVVLLLLAAAAACGGQDVADCTWQPEEDQLLSCHLKTLQAAPPLIPQVRTNLIYIVMQQKKNGGLYIQFKVQN